MRFLATFALIYVTSALDPYYSPFILTSNNPEECSACMPKEKLDDLDVANCLAKVPPACRYNSTVTASDYEGIDCPSINPSPFNPLAISLRWIWPEYLLSTATKVAGIISFTLNTATEICNYEVFTSYHFVDECMLPRGPGIANALTLTKGTGKIDLSKIPAPYLNMKTDDPTCGPQFDRVTLESLELQVTLAGTQRHESTTTESSEETSGAVPLLGFSLTAILSGLLIIA